jgi:hypothetical protein
MNAINDALKPFGAKVFAQPFTPERILAALGKVPASWPAEAAVTVASVPSSSPAHAPASAAPPPAEKVREQGLLTRLFGRKG